MNGFEKRIVLVIFCLVSICMGTVYGQESTRVTRVSGTVTYSTGDPASGVKVSALVTLSDGARAGEEIVVTDQYGRYEAILQLDTEARTPLTVVVSALDSNDPPGAIARSSSRMLVVGDTLPGIDLEIDRELRILNFVSGPVCHNEDGTENICKQAEDIDVKGESTCDWSGEKRRCTWFGFQFDYEHADPSVPIRCDYRRSRTLSESNWEGLRQKSADSGSFTYELESSSGHFYNPMFELYSVPPVGLTVFVDTELQCTYKGKPAFEMAFRARFATP